MFDTKLILSFYFLLCSTKFFFAQGCKTQTQRSGKQLDLNSNDIDKRTYNCSRPLQDAKLISDQYCAQVFADNLDQPRGLFVTAGNHILVIERGTGEIISLFDNDHDLVVDEIATIAKQPGLNHGLAVFGPHVYASSSTTVYRWPYTEGQKTVSKDREIVVKNINEDGKGGAPFGHTTRTIVFDKVGRLYIAVGSAGNIDRDSFRARIRRFTLFNNVRPPVYPEEFNLSGELDFTNDGEVFADGLRNEVGLGFDKFDVLWGVENSADRLRRNDLGGDIHNENPAEELNRFLEEDKGKHWGYPYCWTEFDLQKYRRTGAKPKGRGTPWAWPTFKKDGKPNDEWCQSNKTMRPMVALQAHSAPLGISFYKDFASKEMVNMHGGLPIDQYENDAFIGYHGSWNRDTPTGFKVVYIPFNETKIGSGRNALKRMMPALADGQGSYDEQVQDFLWNGRNRRKNRPTAKWRNGFRPVDVKFDKLGRLLVSSDGSRRGRSYKGSMVVMVIKKGT